MKKATLVYLWSILLFQVGYAQTLSAPMLKQIRGSGNQDVRDIAVDLQNNIYTIGYFESTVDLDPGVGVVSKTAVGPADVFLCKYSPTGELIWANQLGGNGPIYDRGIKVIVGEDGYLYVGGLFSGTSDFDFSANTMSLTTVGFANVFFAKYDLDANLIWAKHIPCQNINSMHLDASGVYISGYYNSNAIDVDAGPAVFSLSFSGLTDAYFVKYNLNGNFVWANTLNGSNYEYGYALTTNSTGDVFAVGTYTGTTDLNTGAGIQLFTAVGQSDIYILKFTASGEFAFAKSIGSETFDNSYDITTDQDGNIILGGYYKGTIDLSPGAAPVLLTNTVAASSFLVKYDVNGNYLAHSEIRGLLSNSNSILYDLHRSADNQIYATGYFQSSQSIGGGPTLTNSGNFDIFYARFNADLVVQASARAGSPGDEYSTSIKTNTNNEVFISGSFSFSLDFDPNNPSDQITSSGAYDGYFAKIQLNYPEFALKINGTEYNAGSTINYPSTVVGASANITYQIFNGGAASLLLTGSPRIQISGNNPGDFFITQYILSSNVVPNGSTYFYIQFYPTAPGVRDAVITILNNDQDENPFTFHVSGVGISPNSIQLNTNATSVCDGLTSSVEIIPAGTFNAGNSYTLEMSDIYGQFPGTVLNSLTGTTGGTLSFTIPAGTPVGNYYLRAVSTSPYVVSNNVGPIQILQTPVIDSVHAELAICNASIPVDLTVYPSDASLAYAWNVESGATISQDLGTTISVLANDLASFTATVVATHSNGCVSLPVTKLVERILPMPSAIAGLPVVCPHTNNLIYSVDGTGTFNWTYSGNTGFQIKSGNGTSQLVAMAKSVGVGTLSVIQTNTEGCISVPQSITIETKESFALGNIVGAVIVCPNATGVQYSIDNFSGAQYTWTVPGAATIVSGQGTAIIMVNFTNYQGKDEIAVSASHPDYCSAYVTSKKVMNPSKGGSNNCVGVRETFEDVEWSSEISLHPNPTEGSLNITSMEDVVEVRIVNALGTEVAVYTQQDVDVSSLSQGLYTAIVKTNAAEKRIAFIKK